jgi:hypothetical protein
MSEGPTQEVEYFDPSGNLVESREAALTAALAAVEPAAVVKTACVELHNGAVTFTINVNFNPNTFPFLITGGTITTGICGAPWVVTGGFMGNSLRVEARRQGAGSCANTIIIVGSFQNPPSWRGTYGFDGLSTSFQHTTLFRGYSPC